MGAQGPIFHMTEATDEAGPTRGPEDTLPTLGSTGPPGPNDTTPCEPTNDPASWPRIPGYRLEKLLGTGGMGAVFRAVEIIPNHPVAIKVFFRIWKTTEVAKARFEREIKLACQLVHPHIARVYHCGDDPCHYFAMELVDGEPLNLYIQRTGPDRTRKLKLFLVICKAVAHAHRSMIVHLDLKPPNILIDKEGQPRVLDFGLAMALSDEGGWESIQGAGSLGYMSPEQANRVLTRNNAAQSDVFSLGATLYWLLTGEFAHSVKGSNSEIIARIGHEPIRPPRRFVPDMPGELAAMLAKALSHDPLDRYVSAAKFAEDVENYLETRPVKAMPRTPAYVTHKWVLRNWRGLTLITGILAILLSMAVWSYANIAHARTLAELRQAELLVSQGELFGNAGKWEEAKESYRQAHDLFVSDGAAPTTADLGLWNAFRHAPPPLGMVHADGGVMDVALTPDGRRVVTVSQDGRLQLWDAPAGQRIGAAIQAHTQAILSIALAPGADLALTGSEDSTAKLISLTTGKIVTTLNGGDGWITRVALSADGRRALTVANPNHGRLSMDDNDRISVWSLPDGKPGPAAQAGGQVVCAAFSPDGSLIATGGSDLAVWDAATLRRLPLVTGNGQVLALAFSPDGKQLAGGDSYLRLWDIAGGRQVWAVRTGASAVNAVAFARDGKTVVSVGNDGLAQTWSRAGAAELSAQMLSNNPAATASVLCANGDVACRVSADDVATFWDAAAPVELRRISAEDLEIHDAGLLCDGQVILAGTSGGLKAWDLASGMPLKAPPLAVTSADAAAVAPDGATAAVMSGNDLLLLDPVTWKILATASLDRRPKSPAVLAFSPNGRQIVCPGPEFSLSLRDARTLVETGRLSGHTAPVATAAFSADSERIVSGGGDQVLRIWNAASCQPLQTLPDNPDAVNAVVVSGDGRFAYSAGGNSRDDIGQDDFAVRQWDLASGRCVNKFVGHQDRVRALAINRDGSILASASDDKTIILWRTSDGRPLSALTGHTAPVISVRFLADGMSLLSAGEDHAILIWNLIAPRRRNELADQAGERFAFLGLDDWAAGMPASHLTLARCLWRQGRFDRAIVELNAARADGEVPADYLAMCLTTLAGRANDPR
jgi:WD40 repeat protein